MTLLVHATAVFLLTGLIWTIQLVHYPGFADVERRQWPAYHRRHSRNITIIVLPLMLTELATSAWLLWHSLGTLHLVFLGCSLFTWLLTALVFVPIHQRIGARPNEGYLRKLNNSNWLRTLTWTICSIASFISLMNA
jgi:hypothetical protein